MARILVVTICTLSSVVGLGSSASQDATDKADFYFWKRVPASALKVELSAGTTVTRDKRGLILPLKVTNASTEAIKLTLTHEWHGGKWPSTSLFAGVSTGPKGPFAPVYLAGEDPDAPSEVALAAGKSSAVELRMDWPGTGSVIATPLIQRPGKYKIWFAAVFEVNGKREHVTSQPIEVEYKGE
jgi:hypothetical protein